MKPGVLVMSLLASYDRRNGDERRSERRGNDRRRVVRSPFECVYDIVHDIYKWTDIPAQNGETGLWKRNWRTWFGHMTVSAVVVAFGRWIGLHAGFFYLPLNTWLPAIAAFAVTAFYFNREYGLNGDYWNRKKEYDSKSDSVLDFWVVLPPVFILLQITMVNAVLVALAMATGIYLMSRYIDA